MILKVYDMFAVQTAANKALVNEKNGTMKTKSLATELLYQLSPSVNVKQ